MVKKMVEFSWLIVNDQGGDQLIVMVYDQLLWLMIKLLNIMLNDRLLNYLMAILTI